MGIKADTQQIEECIVGIHKTLQTLVKNPNRKYTHTTLLRKLRYARSIKTSVEGLLERLEGRVEINKIRNYSTIVSFFVNSIK